MRIVTRPDFDGIVCAVLLKDAERISEPVKWVQPGDMQKGLVEVVPGDILANLPYDERCSMWFDHHYSNRIETSFDGAFKIAPSAAGVVFDYYKQGFQNDYRELVAETDKIDSAQLSMEEVVHPEKHKYILLSMTISDWRESEILYWNRLVDLLGQNEIEQVLQDTQVKEHCEGVIEQNVIYKDILYNYTKIKKHVSITDFRSLDPAPNGNRFLSYSLFPETVVSVKIRYDRQDREKVILSVGHSIFNRNCNVNAGLMLSAFEGGGHRGAGACNFHISKADEYIPKIIDILLENEPNE